MKSYYIEDFTDKSTYIEFIRYMLSHSDYFSFVCFKYKESERTKRSTKEVLDLLKPYREYAKNVNEWPGNMTLNENNHIYRLFMYSATSEAISALSKADRIYDWDYPKFPMDLAFYKNGYAWFESVSHERWNSLYTADMAVIDDLKQLGVDVIFNREVDESTLFNISKSKVWGYADKWRL